MLALGSAQNRSTLTSSRQELAHLECALKSGCPQGNNWFRLNASKPTSSNDGFETCQHRYFSPSRSAIPFSRPTTQCGKATTRGANVRHGVELFGSKSTLIPIVKSNRRGRACQNSRSLQCSPLLPCQGALKPASTSRQAMRQRVVYPTMCCKMDCVSTSRSLTKFLRTASPDPDQTQNSHDSTVQGLPLRGVLRS